MQFIACKIVDFSSKTEAKCNSPESLDVFDGAGFRVNLNIMNDLQTCNEYIESS